MAKDPAFLFYPGDWLTGTMFFSNEQAGKYIRLLCSQHQHGGFIEKNSFENLVGDDKMLRSKFIETEHGFYNVRLSEEMISRQKKSTNISEAAKETWNKRKGIEKNTIVLPSYNDSNTILIRPEDEDKDEDKNELWTNDILLERDFKFSEMAHNELSESPDAEWIKSHLVKCNRDDWKFTTQHKFRKSLIGWLKTCIKNKNQKKIINSQPQFDPIKR